MKLWDITFCVMPEGTDPKLYEISWKDQKSFTYAGSLDALEHELRHNYGDRLIELHIREHKE
jgi:hypothetical protein